MSFHPQPGLVYLPAFAEYRAGRLLQGVKYDRRWSRKAFIQGTADAVRPKP